MKKLFVVFTGNNIECGNLVILILLTQSTQGETKTSVRRKVLYEMQKQGKFAKLPPRRGSISSKHTQGTLIRIHIIPTVN